jgi:prepilin-type N-terminal cleavage/methylation domain-containing protein
MTRRGMTLVEMLVAVTATLVLMAAVAQAFGVFGVAISGSRATLDLDARMRTAAWRLRSDLGGVTARLVPPLAPESGEGYFEIIEGVATDADAAHNTPVGPADHDDVLLFTTRSTDAPFIGRQPTDTKDTDQLIDNFESTQAEVAWFARATPGTSNPVTYTLYRRQLLVMGYVGTSPFHSGIGSNNSMTWAAAGSSWAAYFNLPLDVSVRRERNGDEDRLFPNTLADLTKRENRFMHNVTGTAAFPFMFLSGSSHQIQTPGSPTQLPSLLSGLTFDPVQGIDDDGDTNFDEAGEMAPRTGEDVILTNVLAFDVRVFDPVVPVVASPVVGTPLVPGDPGYSSSDKAIGSGAYVDLGYTEKGAIVTNSELTPVPLGARNVGHFSGSPQNRSQLGPGKQGVYDTWSTHYEANGLDEDGDGTPDQGSDGIDNPRIPGNPASVNGKVDEPPVDVSGGGLNDGNAYNEPGDDPGEVETSPPYPYPLRGIEVRIRCYEPASRQVRQVTVRHTFVPH